MAKNVKEQLDYGNTPERMDPSLVKKLASPESLYGSNPAMKKGPADVQRLVSQRFQKVADKLRQVTGIENLSSQQVQGMVYQEMMSKIPTIMQIEGRHKEELEDLAKQASMEETEIPEGWVKIKAKLGSNIDTSKFQIKPKEEKKEKDDKPKLEIPSFDVSELTDEEEFELEKHKRNIINAIIQGAAKKGHYVFQKPDIKARLDEIDPRLYPAYLGIMTINDFMYFTMEQMIEMMSQTGNGVGGKVELDPDDEDEDDGENGEDESEIDTVIDAQGMIFPILCHEIIKGIEESKGRYGLPTSDTMRDRVKGAVDILPNEPMQLRIGPEISEKLRFALPDEMFDESNKGLINWFHILLYQVPAQEFLDIIGNAISEDESKVKKATSRFKEIMKEAIQMRDEFENYKEEGDSSDFSNSNNFGDDDDDDDDLDDFLGSLGIVRPK